MLNPAFASSNVVDAVAQAGWRLKLSGQLGAISKAIHKAIDDHDAQEVEVETVMSRLGLDRISVVSGMKEIGEKMPNYGSFIVGRRGQPSRFCKQTEATAQFVVQEEQPIMAGQPEPGIDSGDQVLLLRRPVPRTIRLPADLSPAEAQKIIDWIKVVFID